MKILFAILLLLVAATGVHYLLADRDASRDTLDAVVSVTGISQPSLGVAWYAPRMLTEAATADNPAYPELDPLRRSDYVYAQ